ncbi:MAG: efflux RND transporter periplasmic adaptor subunit [Acidobacteriota bacterium]
MNTTNQELNHQEVAKTLEVSRSGSWPRRLKRLATWVIFVGTLCAAAWHFFVRETNTEASVRYLTQPAVSGDLRLTITATGNLEPTNEVEVGSEISGMIETVEVERDEYVTAGQVLARVNTTKLEAQAAQLESALQAAQARLLQSQATLAESRSQLSRLERVRELSGGKVPSQQELEAGQAAVKRAEADEASAKAAVSQAQATLDATRTDLSKAIIKSPINGVVLKRSIEPGQTVAATFQAPVLFTIAEDLRRMELHVDVDEADVSQVRVGQRATFAVDAYPERKFAARITKVSFGSETVEGVVIYEAVLDVKNPELLLRPGMTATAEITTRITKNALLVPNAALRFSPDDANEQTSSGSTSLVNRLMPRPPAPAAKKKSTQAAGREQQLYVLREGKPVAVKITVGATDGMMTEVIGGDLKPGTALVVETLTGRSN